MRRPIRSAVIVAVAAAVAGPAQGQLTSGSTSAFGNRSLSGPISTGGGLSNRTTGGAGQQGLSAQNGLMEELGQEFGQIGLNRAASAGFFGTNATTQQGGGFFGSTAGGMAGRGGGFGGGLGGGRFGGQGNFGGRNGQNNFGRNDQDNRMYYRPRRTVAFTVPNYRRSVPDRVVESLRTIAARSGGVSLNVAGVEATVVGDRLVIHGTAATPEDRALAEQLARFEPGVSEIVNEIVVAGQGPPPSQE